MIIETYAQSRAVCHAPGTMFRCGDCGEVKPVQTAGGTGYGWHATAPDSSPICYACCSKRERELMISTGKATLYLTQQGTGAATVTDWPGGLKFAAGVKQGRHNIAGRRYDVWFTGPDGRHWHGVTYGDNTQICHCKRLKAA